MSKPCRHCGSPARNNPCWYALDRPEYVAGGGDPPCVDDIWAEQSMARERRLKRKLALIGAASAITLAVVLFAAS
jgi:hypothetical protein